MIHLDTGFLISMVQVGDAHHAKAIDLARKNPQFASSSIAWMEFQSRPVPAQEVHALLAILTGGILPFEAPTANLAGELYHLTGSKRRTRLDTMIAATAILSGAELATTNPADFEPFVPHGLKIHKL